MKYGVSFNCSSASPVDGFDIGGGGEGDTSIDYVSDDLNKLIEALTGEQDYGAFYVAKTDHELVGRHVDVGDGPIVAVIGEHEGSDDYFYVACVVFEDPNTPTVIK